MKLSILFLLILTNSYICFGQAKKIQRDNGKFLMENGNLSWVGIYNIKDIKHPMDNPFIIDTQQEKNTTNIYYGYLKNYMVSFFGINPENLLNAIKNSSKNGDIFLKGTIYYNFIDDTTVIIKVYMIGFNCISFSGDRQWNISLSLFAYSFTKKPEDYNTLDFIDKNLNRLILN